MGLLTLLGLAVGLDVFGRLTPEMVDVIKWIGAGFMSVRAVANATENLGK